MKLSILIPTYRRPRNVEQTVQTIQVLMVSAPFDWKIVISNNLPAGRGSAAVSELSSNARGRIVFPDTRLPSAEENFRRINPIKGHFQLRG